MNTELPINSSLAERLFLTIDFGAAAPVPSLPFPKNNLVGALLLAQLVEAKLEAGSQLIIPVAFVGPLNKSIFVCTVADWRLAMEIILAVLDKVALRSLARLYRVDSGELILRQVLPGAGQDILPADFFSDVSSVLIKQEIDEDVL